MSALADAMALMTAHLAGDQAAFDQVLDQVLTEGRVGVVMWQVTALAAAPIRQHSQSSGMPIEEILRNIAAYVATLGD